MFRNLLSRLKHGTEGLNYGRDIVLTWSVESARRLSLDTITILDIGVGKGVDLLNVKSALAAIPKQVELLGVECYEPNVQLARTNGITVFSVNIEYEAIPLQAGSIDLLIANQIVEHTKELFWIFSEISRVLKPGGQAIVGVPNLASLHNRIMLLLGEQPSSIELLGPHVRGFTRPAFTRFITCEDFFEVKEVKGSNFYPFPPTASKVLSKAMPTLSVGLFFLIERSHKKGCFIEILDSRFYETPYFRGKTIT